MHRRLLYLFSALVFSGDIAANAAGGDHIETPPVLPTRNLRTLERNPNGYQDKLSGVATVVLLGDLLFHTPNILGPKARAMGLSCQACHPNGSTNQQFFIDGLSSVPGTIDLSSNHFSTGSDNALLDPLSIPSLRGIRYSAPYGFDGRESSLRNFIDSVVIDEFGGELLSPQRREALLAYVIRLDFVPNSAIDRLGRLRSGAVVAAYRGEELFRRKFAGLGDKSCADCHDPTAFFRDGLVHRRASSYSAGPNSYDDGIETPTLINVVETAPYFHDGRIQNLEAAIDWYDKFGELSLTASAKTDLIAYLETIGASDRPSDDRPLAKRLVEDFAYLQLLSEGPARDDREIWLWSLDLVKRNLTKDPTPLAIRETVIGMAEILNGLILAVEFGTDLELLRPNIDQVSAELNNLAADWAGSVEQ